MEASALRYFDIVKIHWKVQAMVHFILSLPIAFLTVYSWGIPFQAVLRLSLAYMGLYFFIYFPFYRILPYITLFPIRREIQAFRERKPLSSEDLSHVVSYLMNYPLPVALLTAVIEFSAFSVGAWVWTTGIFVPELLPILTIALLETFILGVVVAINVSFLNLVMLESYIRDTVEQITTVYPQGVQMELPVWRFSMYTKVLFLILLTTIAGEISIFIFFTTYILSTNPQEFTHNTVFVGAVILVNVLYIFVIAPIIARNFTTPMRKLVRWTQDIAGGNVNSRIGFLTNDETVDIIRGSNLMVDSLEKNRTVIESEKNTLATVLFGVVDGVIALGNNKSVILVNKAAEDITGWKHKEAIGQYVDTVFQLTHEDGSVISCQTYCPELSAKTTVSQRYADTNVRLLTKDGKEKYISLTCSTIGQQKQLETAYIITFHDTTEERQLETMKLDFVSMAAHELRTPVTVIKSYMDVFLEQNKAQLTTEQRAMLSRVFATSQQLSGLIENLLNVSKIERHALKLALEPIGWRPFLLDVVASLQYAAQEKKLTLTAPVPETFSAVVVGDKIRLMEVLSNLITNAITYTDAGGTVTVRAEGGDDEVITHIQDTGVGMPESALAHLFTKFYRVSSNLLMGSNGSGIGLYLSKSIIDMHHGTIWVQSALGKGSTFSFRLPKNQAERIGVVSSREV